MIAEEPISELVPIENAAMPDRTIIQWDKNDLEELGLLKVDVLALGMLTAMRKTFELLDASRHRPHGHGSDRARRRGDLRHDLPRRYGRCVSDRVACADEHAAATEAVGSYYDLVIEVAIVRPGPIKGGMVHPYLQRRTMKAEDIPYASEELRPVLAKTLRRAHLPGAGDADRHRRRQLHAGRGRSTATRDGRLAA